MKIKLDKERKLVFNSIAVYELEALFDKPLTDIISDEKEITSVTTAMKLVWAGLLHYTNEDGDPQFSLKDVISMFPLNKWKPIIEELIMEVVKSLGITEEQIAEEVENQKKTKN